MQTIRAEPKQEKDVLLSTAAVLWNKEDLCKSADPAQCDSERLCLNKVVKMLIKNRPLTETFKLMILTHNHVFQSTFRKPAVEKHRNEDVSYWGPEDLRRKWNTSPFLNLTKWKKERFSMKKEYCMYCMSTTYMGTERSAHSTVKTPPQQAISKSAGAAGFFSLVELLRMVHTENCI